jgi:hypothetical protein
MGVLIIAGITATGHTIDMALMHFLLFYAGVFALTKEFESSSTLIL